MFTDVWSNLDDLRPPNGMGYRGLGANLNVTAYTTDANGNAKTAFAAGEPIYFHVNGPADTGVLVSWRTRNSAASSPMQWNYTSTDGSGNAVFHDSNLEPADYDYTITLPVNGVGPPDPQATVHFTVGSGFSTATPTVTQTTTTSGRTGSTTTTAPSVVRSTPSYVAPTPTLTYTPVPSGVDLLNTNVSTQQPSTCPDGYQYQWNAQGTAIICAPITPQVSAPSVPLLIPRTSTSDPGRIVTQCPAGQHLDALMGYCVPDATTPSPIYPYIPPGTVSPQNPAYPVTPQYTDPLTGQPSYTPYTAQTAAPGATTPAATGSGLPSWLEGDIFGLPKALVLGAVALFLLKGGR